MHIEQLTFQVQVLNKQYSQLAKFRPASLESFHRANEIHDRIVSLEREICRQKSLPFLCPIEDWEARWTNSLNNVHLHSTETKTFITVEYYTSDPSDTFTALIFFESCIAARFLSFDYDNLETNSYYHAGLDGLGAFYVTNSQWKSETKINENSTGINHYFFCFNSCLIEVLASNYKKTDVCRNVEEALSNYFSIKQVSR